MKNRMKKVIADLHKVMSTCTDNDIIQMLVNGKVIGECDCSLIGEPDAKTPEDWARMNVVFCTKDGDTITFSKS